MKRLMLHVLVAVLVAVLLLAAPAGLSATGPVQVPAAAGSPDLLAKILEFPFPSGLVSAPGGQRFVWTTFQRGTRTIWIAEGPDFTARALVTYAEDDGQEITNMVFQAGGSRVIYVRGGNHGGNWPGDGGLMPNPTSSPAQAKMTIWSVPAAGGAPVALGEGDRPVPSPTDDRVAFSRGNEIWVAPADGSAAARRLFFARGASESPVWSPDGRTLAFVSNRGALSYIALYAGDDRPIRYIAPSTSLDSSPRWSPDGTRIAFVRRPGRGGPAQPPLALPSSPWAIWVGDVATGAASLAWQSPDTQRGSLPRTLGGANLHWVAGDRLVFLSEADGWPHLYSVPAGGGPALQLTSGRFMVEFVTTTPDGRALIYNANTGSGPDDGERRHLFSVPVDTPAPAPLTSGDGIEWNPVVSGDGRMLAFHAAGVRTPPLTHVRPLDGTGPGRALDAGLVPADFPASRLVVPEHVTFTAPDGLQIHGQLFKASGGESRKPAIVYVHGGPPRQMLLGWHYGYYYANAYAVNQYLALRGFVVLSVNYRLGIGYGRDFQHADRAGTRGASEYQDVLAGGRYLQGRTDVDASRVGIWGGSYGGYLTALALGRNSDVFAAGVDIHGVHVRTTAPPPDVELQAAVGDGVTRAQMDEALKVAWESSPVAWVKTWKSPVLLIHGDDDRNVRVDQTVDLAQRLRAAGIDFDEIIIPDDIHDFLIFRNWARVNRATAAFFERTLLKR